MVPPGFCSTSVARAPRWRTYILYGMPVFLVLYCLLAFLPLLCGKPIGAGSASNPRRIHLVITEAEIGNDCEIQRAVELLEWVYGPHGYKFDITVGLLPNKMAPAEPDDGSDTIYLGEPLDSNAGASCYQHFCRYTGLAPKHREFSKLTLAHEFGHHRFGDIGLPNWIQSLGVLDPVCDYRNDFVVWLGI